MSDLQHGMTQRKRNVAQERAVNLSVFLVLFISSVSKCATTHPKNFHVNINALFNSGSHECNLYSN